MDIGNFSIFWILKKYVKKKLTCIPLEGNACKFFSLLVNNNPTLAKNGVFFKKVSFLS